jgi:hypothetical protein
LVGWQQSGSCGSFLEASGFSGFLQQSSFMLRSGKFFT